MIEGKPDRDRIRQRAAEKRRSAEALQKQAEKEAAAARLAAGIRYSAGYGNHKLADDVERLKAEIPADTRSLTARLMGDPLPGRSALERR